MNHNNEISTEDKKAITDGLIKLLADSFTLFNKTYYYHRNLKKPVLNTLHQLIETQYTELTDALDAIISRLKELGESVPDAENMLPKLSSVGKAVSIPSEAEMIKQLIQDQEIVVRSASRVLTLSQVANDAITATLLAQRIRAHKKIARALRGIT